MKRPRKFAKTEGDVRTDLSTLFSGSTKTDSEKIQYIGVIVEDLHSKMGLVIEGMEKMHVSFDEKLDQTEQRLGERIYRLEVAVTGHSKQFAEHGRVLAEHGMKLDRIEGDIVVLKDDVKCLKSDVGILKSDVGTIKTDMNSMEARLSGKIDTINLCMNNHETRITVLENRKSA